MTKEYVIKDLIGILAVVDVDLINHAMMDNIQIIKTVIVEKRLVDKLVEEFNENIDEK